MNGDSAREFVFSARDFARIRDLIYRHAGISLTDNKESLVYGRLARRLRALRMTDFATYIAHVERDEEEFEAFVNSLTTNLTAFFREHYHFDTLAEFAREQGKGRYLNIWSAAASTGEEPYSIAMTLVDTLGEAALSSRILATDLDTRVLDVAKRGIYSLDRVEKLSLDMKRRHFLKGKGEQSGKVRINPALQTMLTFRPLNLLSPQWPVDKDLDVIFCRNVMIYFDKPTQIALLERFVGHLRKGGLFFAGHSESFFQLPTGLKLIGRTTYRKEG